MIRGTYSLPKGIAVNHHPELVAAIQAGDLESLRILLAETPSLAAARDEAGVSAIMHALYRRRQDMVDLLLAAAPELDIFEAASLGRMERVGELLRQDAKLAASFSPDGFTPLHFACFFAREEMTALLLRHDADPDSVARNPMKVTPLHSSAAARNLPIVTLLLRHGASPNVHQQQGWTPLHSAAQHGDKALAELLLKHGANRSATSDDGVTPGALATKNGHAEVAELLS
jgi:ankyrin repeat protein